MRAKSVFILFFASLLFFGSFASSQMVYAEPSFSLEFGSFGSGDGDFKSPSGLALDAGSDLLYIADTDNDRIQIIDVDGNCSGSDELANDVCFVDEFGDSGNGDGEFDSPTALVLDTGTDLLYIVDSGNNRIQIIDVNGNCSGNTKLGDNGNDDVCFVDEFGTFGNGDGEFDLPSGLALDTGSYLLYIADSGNNRIQIIDVNGNCDSGDNDYLADNICFVDEFGGRGNGEGEFDEPSGLALDTNNDMLYVADTDNNQIQIIDVDGNCSGSIELANDICFVDEFGGSGSDDGDFNSPADLAIDASNDMLYVLDTKNERIQIIDVDGSCSGSDELTDDVCFVDKFGEFGDDDGEFEGSLALVLNTSDDLLYVADTENDRIQILDISESSSSTDAPSRPTNLEAHPISVTSIFLTWDVADPDEDVTGYKIQFKKGSGSYETAVSNSQSNANSFVHGGLEKGKSYTYQVYAINDEGTSSASSTATEKPEDSNAPAALTANDISPSKIKLSWFPPTSTFGLSINGYEIEREVITDVYDYVANVGSGTTTYTVSGLQIDKTYTYVVKATFSGGSGSPRSNTASATPTEDSTEVETSTVSRPSSPNLTIEVISETQINLSWSKPSDGGSTITGYKIEVKENSGSFSILDDNTKSTSTTFSHTNLTPNSKYTYKVSAINALGVGSSSNQSSGTATDAPDPVLEIKPLGNLSVDEGKRLAFIVGITDNSLDNVRFSLAGNAPSGTSIGSSSGSFTWTPSNTQSGTYTFDVIVKTSSLEDRESITITVNDITVAEPTKDEPPPEPTKDEPGDPKELGIAAFVDESKDPQYYVDRYNNEPSYQKWFDDNYPEYSSISQAVGIKETMGIAPFVDSTQDPQYYVDRYDNEPKYKEWFDENFPEYDSIYEAVGLDEPTVVPPRIGECGEGTKLVDGVCTVVDQPGGGGCLIATAAYGSEMAPQVQFLREIRDNKVMSTELGASFMTGFNQFYYSFSPVIADYERENPLFKEAVKIGLTPMLSSLSILSEVDVDSEQEMLGYGIAIIMLNIGMYFVAPAMVLYGIKKAKLVRF